MTDMQDIRWLQWLDRYGRALALLGEAVIDRFYPLFVVFDARMKGLADER